MRELIDAVNELKARLIQLDKNFRSSLLLRQIYSFLKIDNSKNIHQYRPDPLVKGEFNAFLTELSDIFEQFYALQSTIIKQHIRSFELTKLNDAAREKDAPKSYPAAHELEQTIERQHQRQKRYIKGEYRRHVNPGKELHFKDKVKYSIISVGVVTPFIIYRDIKKIRPYQRYRKEKSRENERFQQEISLLQSSKADNLEFELYQSMYSFYRTFYHNPIKRLYPVYSKNKNAQKKKEQGNIPSANPAPSNEGTVCDNNNCMMLPEEESPSYSDEDMMYEYEGRKPSAPPPPPEYFEKMELDEMAQSQTQNQPTTTTTTTSSNGFFKASAQPAETSDWNLFPVQIRL